MPDQLQAVVRGGSRARLPRPLQPHAAGSTSHLERDRTGAAQHRAKFEASTDPLLRFLWNAAQLLPAPATEVSRALRHD